jgi:ribosomal-protein-alanine N-acetyltransferase
MNIIDFEQKHLDEWEALEAECFNDAWTRAQMQSEIGRKGHVALALMLEDRLAGYACMYHVLDEANITSIAITPTGRKRGFGGLLLDSLIARAEALGLKSLTLEVRRSNLAAIGLYSSRGFEPVGIRPGYYHNPLEDALLMTRGL